MVWVELTAIFPVVTSQQAHFIHGRLKKSITLLQLHSNQTLNNWGYIKDALMTATHLICWKEGSDGVDLVTDIVRLLGEKISRTIQRQHPLKYKYII